ncbi:MAG: acetyl-CoA carboxylase, biotin carboxyl carrier protein [Nitrospirae bacterium RBG_16_64_22]|nr:MAG: acetyl-CoA carboxylase, biotin carboxyl carrier protein [Nitrospirae bacterium RBG_16_64_22]
MNLKEIREIIDLISRTDVSEIEIEKAGMRVRVRRGALPAAAPSAHGTEALMPPPAAGAIPAAPSAGAEETKRDDGVLIRAPIVGTFYRSPAPEAKPYVEVGDAVKKGQIIGLIEAMKLMNEIESEADGRVAEILAENAKPVEYGTPLFRIEPAVPATRV